MTEAVDLLQDSRQKFMVLMFFAQPFLKDLNIGLHGGQGVADLMSNAGRQASEGGHFFRLQQLGRSLFHLLLQLLVPARKLVSRHLEPVRHVVELNSQFFDFVLGPDMDVVVEVACGHQLGAAMELHNGASEVVRRGDAENDAEGCQGHDHDAEKKEESSDRLKHDGSGTVCQ